MKSLTELWSVLATEVARDCDADVRRDISYVSTRVEHEGVSFLTITLPEFCSSFEESLKTGYIASDQFAGYRRAGGLPAFLQGFLRQVFDASGVILSTPSWRAVRAVRQLCLLYKKLELPCTEVRERKAVKAYVDCEIEMRKFVLPQGNLSRTFSYLFGEACTELNELVATHSLKGGHGPGATADRKVGNSKFEQVEWPERLENVFPYGAHVLPRFGYSKEYPPCYLSAHDERPVKVTLVPKTLKGPRIIAVEPTCMQYAQQALWREIPGVLRKSQFPLLVGFSDQEVNRELARKGSITGEYATIDLKEASDRVHMDLVRHLLKPWSHLLDFIEASRSTTAELPFGLGRLELVKFASMGSALCFPIEAMIFASIAVHAQLPDHRPYRHADGIARSTRVFGDDIIVPTQGVTDVISLLTIYGLKVNEAKSFTTGRFRESCGGDYFDGQDVTPVRMKTPLPAVGSHWRSGANLQSNVAFQNLLFVRGWDNAADWVKGYVERVQKTRLPTLAAERFDFKTPSSVPCWYGYEDDMKTRVHRELQQLQVATISVKAGEHEHALNGPWALTKCFASDWSDPAYKKHLVQFGRGHDVAMIRGWRTISQ